MTLSQAIIDYRACAAAIHGHYGFGLRCFVRCRAAYRRLDPGRTGLAVGFAINLPLGALAILTAAFYKLPQKKQTNRVFVTV